MFKPSIEEIKKQQVRYNKLPIMLEVYMDLDTPLSVLNRIKEVYERYFLLESMEGGEKIARYTFIGFHPVASFYVKEGCAFYASYDEVKKLEGNPLEHLKEIMNEFKSPRNKDFPPFTGGAVGYFGYDMVRYAEALPLSKAKDELHTEDMKLMFFDDVIAFDHYKQKMYLITNIEGKDEKIEEAYEQAKRKLNELKDFITQPMLRKRPKSNKEVQFVSNTSKDEYIKKVNKIKDYIKNGDAFQVVLSQIFKAPYTHTLLDVYRVLRTLNPSPYMYFMQFEDMQIAGASPETLVKLKENIMTTMPIAGTRKRGRTEKEDEALGQSLLNDKKELAEHNMLVDLGRNDLGKVSQIDSVEIVQYKALQKFSHVTHLTSTIQGKLKEGLSAVDVIQSILPAGTLSGAPKIRAMEIIDELEEEKRSVYGGGIGYIGYEGNLDTCIAIRTLVKKDGMAYIQAGAGIVLDSDPESEYEECINKATALFEAVRKVGEII